MAADITGAATVIRLSDGRQLEFCPLTDRDIIELDEWVRAEFIAAARDSLEGETDAALRAETLAVAMREAQGMTFMSGHGPRVLATPAGLSRLLFVSARKRHPELKEDELRPLLLDPNNRDAVNEAFARVNLAPDRPTKPARESRSARTRRTGGSRASTSSRRSRYQR